MNAGLKLSLGISLALLAIAGCRRNEEAVADTPQPGTPPVSSTPVVDDTGTPAATGDTSRDVNAPSPTPATGALTQGQAVAMVGAVDKHEIAAAEQAKGKKVTLDVAQYADMLHSEHSKNLEAGQKLGVSESSPEITAMEEKGRADLAALDRNSGKAYEKAYVDAMVKGHEEALSLIDTRLLPAATDENVRTFLNNSRDHVAMHLERGKALQRKVAGAP